MFPEDIEAFLNSLPLRDPNAPRRKSIICKHASPLMVPKEQLITALVGFLKRLQPKCVRRPCKENMSMLLTSAPTGSGTTTFLLFLCQLFEYQWDVDAFITSQNLNPTNSESIEWAAYLKDTLQEVKSDARVTDQLSTTDLAKSFVTSTLPCFVSFGNETPINEVEIEVLGHSPMHMLLARIIFAELGSDSFMTNGQNSWEEQYSAFLRAHKAPLLQLSSLDCIMNYFRKRFNCTHSMIAIDDVLELSDSRLSANMSAEDESLVASRMPRGVRQVLDDIRNLVINYPIYSSIVSSHLTKPLQDFSIYSLQLIVFVPIYPILNCIDPLLLQSAGIQVAKTW